MGVNPLTYRKFTRINNTINYDDIMTIRKNLVELPAETKGSILSVFTQKIKKYLSRF